MAQLTEFAELRLVRTEYVLCFFFFGMACTCTVVMTEERIAVESYHYKHTDTQIQKIKYAMLQGIKRFALSFDVCS